ncbi:hypothetical protein KLEP181_gp36 [Paracoccus phage vB_PmaP_KLEP18-1]|nr:hypothetical protein KLEP181_gp36 [Paracoccus phage vB_PmaP_KLEP18-1]
MTGAGNGQYPINEQSCDRRWRSILPLDMQAQAHVEGRKLTRMTPKQALEKTLRDHPETIAYLAKL